MALSIPYCYGREYPRAPRGESIGCLDGNWPARWQLVSGPTFPGAWSLFNEHQLVYGGSHDMNPGSDCEWNWIADDNQRKITLIIRPNNVPQTSFYWEIFAHRPGFGGHVWLSDDLPWGNYAEIVCHPFGGGGSGLGDTETDFIVRRSAYADLPTGFCAAQS